MLTRGNQVMAGHCSEDELTLYYYGEGRHRDRIERHLAECAACDTLYRRIAGTLELIAVPDAPERGDQYGLEVWQRIRHQLPEQAAPIWSRWFRVDRLAFAAAAAMLIVAAFVAGRVWPRGAAGPAPSTSTMAPADATAANADARAADVDRRILLASVADHLDRSERVLTDIMHAPDADISSEQARAEDLLTASRLYRQDAVDANEQSVAAVLDEIERNLLEVVHSPAKMSASDLEQIRRRIDAAALLFKVRVMSDELRQREQTPADGSEPRTLRTATRKTS
jgi:hypothetical protein